MPDANLPAILVAAIVVFVIGFTYYAVLGKQLAEVSDAAAAGEQPPPWKMAVEFSRGLILAAVIAGLGLRGRDRQVDRRPAARTGALDRVPARALDRRRDPRKHALEARRHPRRRLAPEAAAGRCDRERLAVTASLGARRWALPPASTNEYRPNARAG
jgi:hypothetical protein